MSITPAELREARFPIVRRGYDTEAVDRALGHVADAIDELLRERAALQAAIQRYLDASDAPAAAPANDAAMLQLLGDTRAIRSLLETIYEDESSEHPDR